MQRGEPSKHHSVVAAVIVRDNRVLLCHRHPDRVWYPDVWDLPGGHIEPGEEPTEALVRELEEELGIVVDPKCTRALSTYSPDPSVTISVWAIDAWSGQLINAAPAEHDRIEWFKAGEMERLKLADSYVIDAARQAMQ